MTLSIGPQVDHYEIREHIADGGSGHIYRACDLKTGQDVALKIPSFEVMGDIVGTARFQREMEIVTSLRHPVIQKGLETGHYERTPYLVTEYISGTPLRMLIRSEGPLPVDRAINLIRKIADGLAFCHDHDVIHRDLKPENILITSGDNPVILDFGIAHSKGSHRVTYGNLSSAVGTPDYMAPEQFYGSRCDARADLYALAVIFYELLTGNLPYESSSDISLQSLAKRGSAKRLNEHRKDVSPQLSAVILRCLLPEPDARYANVHAVLDALNHLESVELSVLDQATETDIRISFWSSPVGAVVIGILMLIGMALIGLLAQSVQVSPVTP